METTVTRRRPVRDNETPELIPDYFAKIDKDKLLTYEEEVELSRRAKVGDRKARQRLIEKNLGLWSRSQRNTGDGACLSRISSRRAT